MRSFIAVCGLLALAGCDAGAGGGGSADPQAPKLEATAKEISAAFQENEAKAKMTYEGKSLIVTGAVKDIDLSLGDTPVIKLKGSGDQYGMGVNADGKMTDVDVRGLTKEQAAEIKKGQSMTFLCNAIDEVLGSPQLDNCSITEAPAKATNKKN